MTIYIDIHHSWFTYVTLCYKLESIGWSIHPNARENPLWIEDKVINGIPRYFNIDMESLELAWSGYDMTGGVNNEDSIDSPQAAADLIDFLYANVDTFRDVPVPAKEMSFKLFWNSPNNNENAYFEQEKLLKAMAEQVSKTMKPMLVATQKQMGKSHYAQHFYDSMDTFNPYEMPDTLKQAHKDMYQQMYQMKMKQVTEQMKKEAKLYTYKSPNYNPQFDAEAFYGTATK